jgi:hypothetical protein
MASSVCDPEDTIAATVATVATVEYMRHNGIFLSQSAYVYVLLIHS